MSETLIPAQGPVDVLVGRLRAHAEAHEYIANLSGVWGDLTGVRGDLTGVTGDLAGVRGDLSGVCGYITGVLGDDQPA